MTIKLYIGLKNPWSYDINPFGNTSIVSDNFIILSPSVHPGDYLIDGIPELITIRRYKCIKINEHFKSIGRYDNGLTTVDVVFNINHEEFSEKEQQEWYCSNHGYWEGWSYDLETSLVADITQELIKDLPERDPKLVVRYIAKVVNEKIIEGSWRGEYSDGRSPLEWNNSYEIFLEYTKKKKPVKYGQCWVFTECLTSIYRYLGIPSRSICINGARIDRGNDGGIDYGVVVNKSEFEEEFYIEIDNIQDLIEITKRENRLIILSEQEQLSYSPDSTTSSNSSYQEQVYKTQQFHPIPGDSYWNYHFWNEVFLGEWFCIDGTPLCETSHQDYPGSKINGPCPVKNINKKKKTEFDFDYFYSTLNSVVRYWKFFYAPDGGIIFYVNNIEYQPTLPKIQILTREPGTSKGKLDITDTYRINNFKRSKKLYHLHDPIVFDWSMTGKLNFTLENSLEGDFLVRLVYLSRDEKVVSLYEQFVKNLEEFVLPKENIISYKVSVLILNLTTREFWVNVL